MRVCVCVCAFPIASNDSVLCNGFKLFIMNYLDIWYTERIFAPIIAQKLGSTAYCFGKSDKEKSENVLQSKKQTTSNCNKISNSSSSNEGSDNGYGCAVAATKTFCTKIPWKIASSVTAFMRDWATNDVVITLTQWWCFFSSFLLISTFLDAFL